MFTNSTTSLIINSILDSLKKGDKKRYETQREICLHDQCPECKGTGRNVRTKSPCIHMISCPCKKCSPTYLEN